MHRKPSTFPWPGWVLLILLAITQFSFWPVSAQSDDYTIDFNDSSANGLLVEGNFQGLRPVESIDQIDYLAMGYVSISDASLRSAIEAVTPPEELAANRAAYNNFQSMNDITRFFAEKPDVLDAWNEEWPQSNVPIVRAENFRSGGDGSNSPDTFYEWDPVALVNLARNDVIDLEKPTLQWVGGIVIETVSMRPEFVGGFRDALWQNSKASKLADRNNINETMQEFLHNIHTYSSLEASLLKDIGKIYFGNPLIFSADEIDLRVPRTVSANSDVFWMEIPVTVELYDSNTTIDEIFIKLEFQDSYRILDMVPLMIGIEEKSEMTKSTPELSVEAAGSGLTVGEIFSKKVSFSNIRPTIIGSGLGLNWLSWSLHGDAVRYGSHRFVAVIGAPKGIEEATVGVSGHLKVNWGIKGLWGRNNLAAMPKEIATIGFQ